MGGIVEGEVLGFDRISIELGSGVARSFVGAGKRVRTLWICVANGV